MDSLLHIIGSLNIDLDEATAKFSDIPSVRRKNAFITRQAGIGQMFQYTLRDESNHIELGRYILTQLIAENPDMWTPEFRVELIEFMREGCGTGKGIRAGLPAGGWHRHDAVRFCELMSISMPTAGSRDSACRDFLKCEPIPSHGWTR
jgi:ribonucleoside-diphosphate reductase beta chain